MKDNNAKDSNKPLLSKINSVYKILQHFYYRKAIFPLQTGCCSL